MGSLSARSEMGNIQLASELAERARLLDPLAEDINGLLIELYRSSGFEAQRQDHLARILTAGGSAGATGLVRLVVAETQLLEGAQPIRGAGPCTAL